MDKQTSVGGRNGGSVNDVKSGDETPLVAEKGGFAECAASGSGTASAEGSIVSTAVKDRQEISKATLARMPLYLHFLQEESSKGAQYISSTVIAQNISVSSVLVRKDLALVSSEAGRPRLGFAIGRLIVDIEKFLGYDNLSDAIIVGAGGLGRAMLGYEGFKSNGLNIVAAFDVAENLIGTRVLDKEILPLSALEQFVEEHKIRIGIITVPKAAAQEVLNKMVEAGIKAIWNFAPAPLRVPKDIVLKTEDLAASLAMLAGKLYKTSDK